jgi:hypothetical protein
MASTDYVTVSSDWLDTQSGIPPYNPQYFDPVPRYIRNGRRDLAEATHYDHTYHFFTHAALIIFDLVPETLLDATPPFRVCSTSSVTRTPIKIRGFRPDA